MVIAVAVNANHNTTEDCLNRQQIKLLPVDYYMVTFTLPFELRALAQRHEKDIYNAMFQVSASVLKDFGNNATRTQANVGFTSVLHTHRRRRDYHPHLHIIVPAGRFDSKRRQWQKKKAKYLFNAFNLAKVWRFRLLEALMAVGLTLPDNLPKKVGCGLHQSRSRKIGVTISVEVFVSRRTAGQRHYQRDSR